MEANQVIASLLGLLIGLPLVALRLITTIFKSVLSLFHVKTRTAPPSCLLDPELGEHKYITVNGAQKIHYVESGDPAKPLILFVHGFPEFWWTWRAQIKHFNKKYRVVALDMRGYNESGKPAGVESYMIEHLVGDVKGLIQGLGVSKCTLVAHDWGAVVCWAFATLYPEMLERLVIMNGPNMKVADKVFAKNKSQYLKSWYILWFQCPILPELSFLAKDMESVGKIFKNSGFEDDEESLEAWKYAFKDFTTWNCSINWYRALVLNKRQEFFNQKSFDSKIQVRTLQIHGTGDHALSVASAKENQEVVENGRLELLEGISHWVQNQAPQRVNSLIEQFLEE